MPDDFNDQSRKIDTGGGDYHEGGQREDDCPPGQRQEMSVSLPETRPLDLKQAERAGEHGARIAALEANRESVGRVLGVIDDKLDQLLLNAAERAGRDKQAEQRLGKCERALFGNGSSGVVEWSRTVRALIIFFIFLIVVTGIIGAVVFSSVMSEIAGLQEAIEALQALGG